MPSLLGRFFQAGTKPGPNQSDGPAEGDPTVLTLDKKTPTHIRAKKSISSLLGRSSIGSSAHDKFVNHDLKIDSELTSQFSDAILVLEPLKLV